MGTKGQRSEVNMFVSEKPRRGEHEVARATIPTRGDGEKQRGRQRGMAVRRKNQ